MLTEERHTIILEILREKGIVKLNELVETLNTSESTIRRDIIFLESINALKRIHGGATLTRRGLSEPSYNEKEIQSVEEKKLIARYAASLIEFMKDSVNLLKEKGYKVVVATNPLFPLKAIHHRIRWAGFEPEDFSYVSSFEANHYCKPQLKYYEEILKDISKTSEDCLMVGNDVQEDLVSKKLGIKTYLITDNLIHRTEDEIKSDYIGKYEDFHEFVKSLPCL